MKRASTFKICNLRGDKSLEQFLLLGNIQWIATTLFRVKRQTEKDKAYDDFFFIIILCICTYIFAGRFFFRRFRIIVVLFVEEHSCSVLAKEFDF